MINGGVIIKFISFFYIPSSYYLDFNIRRVVVIVKLHLNLAAFQNVMMSCRKPKELKIVFCLSFVFNRNIGKEKVMR